MGTKSKLLGKYLTTDANNKWKEHEDKSIEAVLEDTASGPRILFISPSEKPKPFAKLALDKDCKSLLTERYRFPKHVFEKTWFESNGFASLRRLRAENGRPAVIISWLRVLVKIIKDRVPSGEKGYYWHEMTFLFHEPEGGAPTVICCDVHEGLDRFYKKTLSELTSNPTSKPDWRYIYAVLLRQVVQEVDYSVWACSTAVRNLETNRPSSTEYIRSNFDFPFAHDILRHALHTNETLQSACQTLKDWLKLYEADQIRPDETFGAESYHDDILASLQLLQSLSNRALSNEARLRNEISLAFNVVGQQDTKAVRIISVVTLLFLPATFVSTLFSMSFFNFQPPYEQGWGVSPKIWIYFVVSVPLTVLTFILWTQLSRILRLMERKGEKETTAS